MKKPSLFHAVVIGGAALAIGCPEHHRVERRADASTPDARIVFPDVGGPDARSATSCEECTPCTSDPWCWENCDDIGCIL